MSILTANFTFQPDSYKTSTQGIIGLNGRNYLWVVGRATLTDALQTAIPLNVYYTASAAPIFQSIYPFQALTVPSGGQIVRVDFRLPKIPTAGDESIYGIDLPKGCTIIGTTGENLKVSPTTGTTHSVTAPAIASANNAYTHNSQAVLSRPDGVADTASPSLLTTVGADTPLQITVSNAGNTAAGNGVRLSQTGARAFIYARVIYSLAGEAVTPWNLDLVVPPGF